MSSKENGGSSAAAIARHKSEREKKLGHRRVGSGGQVTYKKVSEFMFLLGFTFRILHLSNLYS